MLTSLFNWLGFGKRTKFNKTQAKTTVLPRQSHTISRRDIGKYALKVLYRLHEAGYQAYLVGGGVRDLLLGFHPKDFDIATNAHPEEVAALFRNSRLIGRRFRLVHVHFYGHIVEVATFRAANPDKASNPNEIMNPLKTRSSDHEANPKQASFVSSDKASNPNEITNATLTRERESQKDLKLSHSDQGMILRDNIYGTFEEDAWRRDFTVNALYYNIADFSVIDCVGGLKDLKTKIIRIIGEPIHRYREDPVRMLRAIRFAAKLNFSLHPETAAPFKELAPLLHNIPGARLFDEYLKLFLSGHAIASYQLLKKYELFEILFPMTAACLQNIKYKDNAEKFLIKALNNTDQRVLENKSVGPHFLLAVLLWYPLLAKMLPLIDEEEMTIPRAFYIAYEEILRHQRECFALPRRLTHIIRDVWSLQLRLQRRHGTRASELFHHPRFRAAYDFLMLRYHSGEQEVEELANWWTDYIAADDEKRALMIEGVKKTPSRRKKRKSSKKTR